MKTTAELQDITKSFSTECNKVNFLIADSDITSNEDCGRIILEQSSLITRLKLQLDDVCQDYSNFILKHKKDKDISLDDIEEVRIEKDYLDEEEEDLEES